MNESPMTKLICTFCGTEFERKPYKIKKGKLPFCTQSCQIRYSNAKKSEESKVEVICTECKKPFSVRKCNLKNRNKKYGIFCSKKCYHLYMKDKDFCKYVDLVCSVCGKEFTRKSSIEKANRKIFDKVCCSRACSSKVQHSGDENFKRRLFYQLSGVIRHNNSEVGRNIEVGLDVDENYLFEVWEFQNGRCPYTGDELILKKHRTRGEKVPNQASIDRIDSSKGYVRGNIEFISLMANYAKNTWTSEQLIDFCKKVARHV